MRSTHTTVVFLSTLLAVVGGAFLAALPIKADTSSGSGVKIVKPWARATPGGVTVGAAYLEIQSTTKDGDQLVAASSPVAGRVEIHTHAVEDGVMKMRRVEKLEIPAGKAHVLAPGGDHIMLFDLKGPLKKGETLPLTLTFAKAGDVTAAVPIAAIGSKGPQSKGARGSGMGGMTERGSGAGAP
ncbi:MAG: copper chaperone PCu(A)C [Alphaproteobacteria bacterium]|nr:copper chaperone PCu(A)C [Alphaproteobacteria bacterium]